MIVGFALAAATAFNLLCVGTISSSVGSEDGHFKTVYRIDLAVQRFCFDDCTYSMPVAKITDTELILQDGVNPINNSRLFTRVLREDGTFRSHYVLASYEMDEVGRCTPAPFTGLPHPKF